MGAINEPKPAKLFVGLLSGDEELLARAADVLERELGAIDLRSPVWPFTSTDYYRDELGDEVLRQIVFFEELVPVERLAEVKVRTNEIEAGFCDAAGRPHTQRPVNIDPGYMTLSKLVLATTKDYAHRIHLDRGIYAEVTLHYHAGTWHPWPWTYPDWSGETYHPFLAEARNRLKKQLAGRS